MKTLEFLQPGSLRRYAPAALLAVTLAAGACSTDPDEPPAASTTTADTPPPDAATGARGGGAPYAFEQPDATAALPGELLEISGLAVLDDGRLAAVQDEEGILFLLDAATGAVTDRVPFGDGGDFEGIEQAGDRLFVLRSNGNLLELSGWAQGTPGTRTYETDLKGRNDTEGLAYDAANGRLLIVTKEEPGAGLDEDRQRAIYAFDPETGALTPDPVFVIDLEEVEGALPGVNTFKPSALAVHPGSGDVYVLSSTDQALIVLGSDGRLRHAWRLPEEQLEQPEGLAFSPGGDLFIASEGVDGPAMLLRFAGQR